MSHQSRDDLGFTIQSCNNGDIIILHHGRAATMLRGKKAIQFLSDLEASEFATQQQMMARLTGNYKRGNERTAKNHPRNRK
ncbi:MAG: hypothetical protein WBP29_07135 [Candidatus Zixiibacteriota bacterium]